ncbi:prephenate dehydratase [Listeria cossartiae subsp. cayugensis]|uniref:Prephenate dehydratase n=1 Tax=Listeria cossartiae subsp. cayugensis TaxID=2713505 RepID=A0A7X1DBF6_9LIST|nr:MULTISPECIES: prephenate dehydratase [Listeria]MBC1805499.1 prephenate dehydratase [Listeria cossartiae subsp. cayugensis]MBC2249605.1 prephenate dehydratase [Listeria cossartiae subsp. cayugensis]MCD2253575.1 prephenate dehydratase [Listeria marthii]MDS9999953.1 prephenate dehydratase [Listeria cossartiae subsp. cayugensis]MDT0003158.1 prephenate dehydratase [Listeria cossartiae subsp. cayugensis]
MKIAYLGPAASFTHAAAAKAFPNEEMVAKSTIPDCIMAIEKEDVDVAVVPIENTIEGSVNITLDYLFHFSSVPVVAEIVLPIAQHLMVHPAHVSAWKSVQKVMSHPQALAQCHTFLQAELYGVEREVTPSTAYAAKWVSNNPTELVAAIAPRMAASEYGLEIVKENAQDLELNQTRFFVLSRKPVSILLPKEEEKTSISVILPNNMPGALHKVLSTFAWRDIDLSKIESRPLKTSLGEYFFLIDVLSEGKELLVTNALDEITLLGGTANKLGTYHVHRLQTT